MTKRPQIARVAGSGTSVARAGEADAKAGFSLVEVSAAIVLLTVAFAGLGLSLTSMTQQREQLETRTLVLNEAQSVMERIVGTDPATVQAAYEGATYTVDGVTGGLSGGAALSVSVQYVDVNLLEVTVTGSWVLRERAEGLTLTTQIYDDQ